MADENWTAAHTIGFLRALEEKPYEFGFFQAVRRLESLYRDRPRVGTSTQPADDPVRFAQEPSTVFAPSTLAAFTLGEGNRAPRLSGYFFGLLGPNGPLPLHLTEYARDRTRNLGDATFARFLDLFHHRMLSLFYRAWAINQPAVSFDRPEDDRFATYVATLLGMGAPALRQRDAFPDIARLRFVAHFANQTRHAAGLSAILRDFFRMPVQVEEFTPGWLHLGGEIRWFLGRSRASGTLGRSATIGARVWSCHHKFRIVFGPLSLAQYSRLLPGGDTLRRLVPLVRSYVGDELDWDVKLVLQRAEVPSFTLGGGGRLGWTTWLSARHRAQDPADLRLRPLAARG
jgi:type VI secretion system protein ImpH